MEPLQAYYNEHAEQARQHENQRERMTNIILTIAGVLIGLITFGELNLASLAASLSLIILGFFGFIFSGKHYERNRFHTAIMGRIRHEIDDLAAGQIQASAPLSTLRTEGENKHYEEFSWPNFHKSNSPAQRNASSWIARQRLHVFWEAVPLLVVAIGLALSIAICVKGFIPK